MKTLIISEKPSGGREMRAALEAYGKFKQGERYFESDQYIITWARGHVVQLKQMKEYEDFPGWDLNALPYYPPNMEFEVKVEDSYKKDMRELREILKRKDYNLVVNACDAGREGDLIFWEVYDYFKLKQPVKRFWGSESPTPEAIRANFKKLRGEDFHLPRRDASYARNYADWMLGMNFTVGFTKKSGIVGRPLHMGRVLTPTIAIIAQRDAEIKNFKPENYYEIEANFGNKYKGQWFKEKVGNTRIDKKEEAESIVNKVRNKTGKVIKKEVKEQRTSHDLLFSLTSLQQAANRKFGYSPKETLEIAQELYEKHKILSYPRTESKVIGTDLEPKLIDHLNAINVAPYDTFVEEIKTKSLKPTKRMINDKALTDHHALIPMDVKPNLSRLNDRERKIYDLVVKRFLSCFYPDAIFEQTNIVTEVEGETFKTNGKILVDPGWKVVYGADSDDEEEDDKKSKNKKEKENKLPPIDENEENPVAEAKNIPKETQPPKHYTAADLLTVMENPRKLLDDKDLQEVMKQAGLGTAATRDSFIDKAISQGYVKEEKKKLLITELGEMAVEISPEALKSPIVTAEWEQKLREVEEGKYEMSVFLNGVKEFIETNLTDLKNSTISLDFKNATTPTIGAQCPGCKKEIYDRNTFYSCGSSTKENRCFVISKSLGKKKISESQVKMIATKGETGMIKGFVSKVGKKFDAKLVWRNGAITFDFGNGVSTEAKETNYKCPSCSSKVMDYGNRISCETSTREEPCVSVLKETAKKTLSEKQIHQLFTQKETEVIKGFKSKTGKNFDAKLVVDGKTVTFKFEERKQEETGVNCPFCGGDVTENKVAFGCSNWKEKSCKFSVWKNSSKKLNIKQIQKLIENGQTDPIDDLKSKKGNIFTAYYELDQSSKKIEMKFQNN